MSGKLGRTAKERVALLRGLASQLIWNGRIETTLAKAKELQPYVEKLITKAVNTFDDNVEVEVTKTVKGKETTSKVVKDGTKKLAARRAIMAKTYDLQEVKGFTESKSAFKARTKDVKHPLVEKMFNELAPKYAQRAEETKQGGGYTRIYQLPERRGDASQMAIIELI